MSASTQHLAGLDAVDGERGDPGEHVRNSTENRVTRVCPSVLFCENYSCKIEHNWHDPTPTCDTFFPSLYGRWTTTPDTTLGQAGEQVAAEHLAASDTRSWSANYRTRWGASWNIVARPRWARWRSCEVKGAAGGRARGRAVRRGRARQAGPGAEDGPAAGCWRTGDRPYAAVIRFDAIGRHVRRVRATAVAGTPGGRV